jgi:UDPglucose 6-dehydrogenase
MKTRHLVIGAGVIGRATGFWLEAHKEDVTFTDIKRIVLDNLKSGNHKVSPKITPEFDVYWICTAEWDVETVLKGMKKYNCIIIVRSTTPPGTIKKLAARHNLTLYHVPEFLREKTALEDIFNPHRVVIGRAGISSSYLKKLFLRLYPGVPLITTDSTTSEFIKLSSNCWLATQISFWNEIKRLCEKYDVNPQEVSNACVLDKRISRYGSMMTGNVFTGFCLPKDILTMKKTFKKKRASSRFLNLVIDINKGK